jgi:hypothetical protein
MYEPGEVEDLFLLALALVVSAVILFLGTARPRENTPSVTPPGRDDDTRPRGVV